MTSITDLCVATWNQVWQLGHKKRERERERKRERERERERDLEESERPVALEQSCFCTINYKWNSWGCLILFLSWPFKGLNPPWIPCWERKESIRYTKKNKHYIPWGVYFKFLLLLSQRGLPSQLHMKSYSPAYTSTLIPSSRRAGIPTARFFAQSVLMASYTGPLHETNVMFPTPRAFLTNSSFRNFTMVEKS